LSFGDLSAFGMRIDEHQSTHAPNGSGLLNGFDELTTGTQTEIYTVADRILEERFKGVIDPSIGYMRNSVYSENSDIDGPKNPNFDDSFVIFLHDFYDSPHIYEDFIFVDFWDWVTFTMDKLISIDANFYVKPHPNQVKLGDQVLGKLKSKYPQVKFLENPSNSMLIRSNLKAVITAYGTVAVEFAYFNIPSLVCAKAPYSEFSFAIQAKSKGEYADLLELYNDRIYRLIQPDDISFRSEAIKYFAMRTSLHDPKIRELNECYQAFWTLLSMDPTKEEILNMVADLESCPGFKKLLSCEKTNIRGQ
jgi:hypothetical protein